MTEPPAEILRRLRPIPTYADHPTTTPHDVVGVAPDHSECRIDVVEAAAPVLLLFLSAACLGCRDLWEGLHELHAGLAGAARLVVVTRSPGEESPEEIAALAGDAPRTEGIDLVMSTAGLPGLPRRGSTVPVPGRRRRRAHRERGLGRGADTAGPLGTRCAPAGSRCPLSHPFAMLGPNREGHRHVDFQGHRFSSTEHTAQKQAAQKFERHGAPRERHAARADRRWADRQWVDRSGSAAELTVDCDCCALRNTDACDDCVVSFLLDREPEDAVVIDADEARAMRMLERAGLVPTLRFSTRAG